MTKNILLVHKLDSYSLPLSNKKSSGGMEKVILTLYNGLKVKSDVKVKLFTFIPENDTSEDNNLITYPISWNFAKRSNFLLSQNLTEYDTILMTDLNSNLIKKVYEKVKGTKTKLKIYIQYRVTPKSNKELFNYLLTLQESDNLILVFNSQYISSEFSNIHLKKEILRPTIFDYEGEIKVKPINERSIDLLCIGRIDEDREVERLLWIMKYLNDEKTPLTLTIVGDYALAKKTNTFNVYSKYCKDMIESLPNIRYLGSKTKNEIYELIKDSKAVVNTCRVEGFGLASFESVKLGTPVLSFQKKGQNNGVYEYTNLNEKCQNLIRFDLPHTAINSKLSLDFYNKFYLEALKLEYSKEWELSLKDTNTNLFINNFLDNL